MFSEWRGRRRLEAHGLGELLARVASAAERVGAIKPVYSELLNLYEIARRWKPRVVFEFGSGWSTIIWARALFDNEAETPGSGGMLYSMDAEKIWARHTRGLLPETLRPHCEVIYSPVEKIDCCGQKAWRHTEVPEVAPDIVYLDGPALTQDCQVAADILFLEDRFPKDFMLIIDGRNKNMLFLKENLKRNYDFWEDRGPLSVCYSQRFFKLVP